MTQLCTIQAWVSQGSEGEWSEILGKLGKFTRFFSSAGIWKNLDRLDNFIQIQKSWHDYWAKRLIKETTLNVFTDMMCVTTVSGPQTQITYHSLPPCQDHQAHTHKDTQGVCAGTPFQYYNKIKL